MPEVEKFPWICGMRLLGGFDAPRLRPSMNRRVLQPPPLMHFPRRRRRAATESRACDVHTEFVVVDDLYEHHSPELASRGRGRAPY
jgi:hypothetical protein